MQVKPSVVRAPMEPSLVEETMSIGLDIQPGGCTRPKGTEPKPVREIGSSEKLSTHELIAWALTGAVIGLFCLAIGLQIVALLGFLVGVVMGVVVLFLRTAKTAKLIGAGTALVCSLCIAFVVSGWFAN